MEELFGELYRKLLDWRVTRAAQQELEYERAEEPDKLLNNIALFLLLHIRYLNNLRSVVPAVCSGAHPYQFDEHERFGVQWILYDYIAGRFFVSESLGKAQYTHQKFIL